MWNQVDALQNTSKRIISICASGRGFTVYKVYGGSPLLALNRTSLNNINALLALSWWFMKLKCNAQFSFVYDMQFSIDPNQKYLKHCYQLVSTLLVIICSALMPFWFSNNSIYCQLRARRTFLQLKDVPLRTRRALLLYKVYGDSALWFSTEHLWSAVTPFWLSADDMYAYGEQE